jgi:hypothetical protein
MHVLSIYVTVLLALLAYAVGSVSYSKLVQCLELIKLILLCCLYNRSNLDALCVLSASITVLRLVCCCVCIL